MDSSKGTRAALTPAQVDRYHERLRVYGEDGGSHEHHHC